MVYQNILTQIIGSNQKKVPNICFYPIIIVNLQKIYFICVFMTTELQELTSIEYAKKFSEKLTFALLKINNCDKNFSEEDEAVLKQVFRIQWFGYYPLYVTKLSLDEQNVIQNGLFDTTSVTSTDNELNGTDIDYTVSEPKL